MRLKHLLFSALIALGVSVLGAQQTPPPTAAPAAVQQPARPAIEISPPAEMGSVRFAIIGDSGTGDKRQYEVGAQMAKALQIFPFEFVIMLGDNIYGRERPQDFVKKFEVPYADILNRNIPFYASLGNHDDPEKQVAYELFNMHGRRYYTFTRGDARFFALDSNELDEPQLKWLEDELSRASERWKIAFFHHPIYSSGARHGSNMKLRARLEPLFVKYGVDAVFAGHEHFYERLVPQNGIYYFTQGGSAKLRRGNIRDNSPLTASGFDTDNVFMVAELGRETMYFQVVSRLGKRVDSGSLPLPAEPGTGADKPVSSDGH